ncbi:MAG: peroxiredoxin Q/BCP [Rhodothermales bacterium]|jgi:peroxiredoxin Q/BCP
MRIRATAFLGAAVLLSGLAFVALPLEGDPPAVGEEAPDFTLVSNEENETTLSDYRGQWVVLYFYPRDFTRGCTIEAHNFQRDEALYTEREAVILGVSVDDVDSHKEFCAKEGLGFKLLADIGGNVSETYGSVRGEGSARLSARNTFLINPEGVVAKVYLGVSVQKHSEEVLAAIDQLSEVDEG